MRTRRYLRHQIARYLSTCLLPLALSGPVTAAPLSASDFAVFAANDLGMHCADLDYQIFSILPPFNVVHAQVIKLGNANELPQLMDDSLIEVVYSATSSPVDPAGANSLNSTSANLPGIFKTNFWEQTNRTVSLPGNNNKKTLGGSGYAPLYPSVLAAMLLDPPVDLSAACKRTNLVEPAASTGCPSILEVFESLPTDTGLPVPELGLLATGTLAVAQQHMPGIANTPQLFDHFVTEQPFFTAFGFGQVITDANWWSGEGIPLMPVDNDGITNPYPLMEVAARDSSTGDVLAHLDVVLPVASEANCQNCHADPDDFGNGAATTFASETFGVVKAADAPGPEQLLNAAKLNILLLHDIKHGGKYKKWGRNGRLANAACNASRHPDGANCLARQREVQCSRCHYSPALDLTQGGPVDEPAQLRLGRQQTRHISMSRAMHGHHGNLPEFMGAPLFPEMPPPDDPERTADQLIMPINAFEQNILEQTCYQCHPGTDTNCLRGAMFSGGTVCQDCHGDMDQVGNDFSLRVSDDNPGDFIVDGSLRVPWASEPACQSCHTGDAMTPNHPANAVIAPDHIRLLLAYAPEEIAVPGVPDPVSVATMHHSPDSPFAENQGVNADGQTVDSLFRLSTGHGGVKCEHCHGSTHAIWPIQNSFANDNIAARQLQGHTGTVTECSTCHGDNSFDIDDFKNNLDAHGRMKGPHGMHPVNDPMWTGKHKEVDKDNNRNSCRACHGVNGEGTVLARLAADRTLECKDTDVPGCNETSEGKRIQLTRGTQVSCLLCHDNEINDD